MNRFRKWPIVPALVVLLVAFAGCEGESPTEPPRPGGTTPGGTPPADPNIALAVSNADPLVGSTTTITATVTVDGQPVTNGTAVEFSTNLGSFADNNSNSTIRTTSGGVASAVLTSTVAGTATVTVRVNNATAIAQINFRGEPIDPDPPGTAPTIISVSPSSGSPAGGDLVVITGTNFDAPVRVLFGDIPATVVSQTSTEIRVISPAVQFGPTEQARDVTITVITRAGTPGEQQATGGPFRYELEILTPSITHVSPSSGPNEGNTRINIIGSGFQAPVRVFFGTGGSAGGALTDQVEAQVLQVSFGQVIALTPPATGLGAELANQQVTIRVVNIASNTDTVMAQAFRYGPSMRITAVGPTTAPAFTPTQVVIDGWGFDDPVAVTLGGIAATPIQVSGTRLVVRTGIPFIEDCGSVEGEVSVTNIEDGTSTTAEGLVFTYLIPQPTILSITPNPVTAGSTVDVTVSGSSGTGRFQIGGITVLPSSVVTSPTSATFTLVVPSNLQFESETCPAGGERRISTAFTITYTDALTGCDDQIDNGLIVNPPANPRLFIDPQTLEFAKVTTGPPVTLNATIVNTGNAPLNISDIAFGPGTSADFSVSPTGMQPAIDPCGSILVSVTYSAIDVGTDTGSVIVSSNAGNGTITLTGSATAPPPP
ncbi:MAG TPA: IPT/TIG domain-containing protein [Thermoanaerobaculia bacterium]|nr:IPT/TIG domain-containing protein [Thermoanaerobaculia bacterium]